VSERRTNLASIPALLTVALFAAASIAPAGDVYNLTGLPAYPHLTGAKMDNVARTDALGHRCTRFAGETSDSLEIVEAWYRQALVGASETDLNHDERYKIYDRLSGIKLAVGVDSVTVYKTANQSTTSIELFRCSPFR